MSAALQGLMGDLFDVRSDMSTRHYLELCRALQALQASVEDEASCAGAAARSARARRRREASNVRETIRLYRRLREVEGRIREIEAMLRRLPPVPRPA